MGLAKNIRAREHPPVSKGGELDEHTLEHLRAWVERIYDGSTDEEKQLVFERMRDFCVQHPIVLERGDTWTNIQQLVFRQILREDKAARRGSRTR